MNPKTYKFSTFQELFDRVPADRIRDCMEELTILFEQSKSAAETLWETFEVMAKAKGEKFDRPTTIFMLPKELEWIDDEKRDVQCRITVGGKELFSIQNK